MPRRLDEAPAVPSRPPPLAATAQGLPPQLTETVPESSQHRDVSRHSVVTVITFHDPLQPRAHDAHRLMHLPAQLLLQRQKLRPHPLRHGSTPYDKVTFRARPTVVGEPSKRERLR